MKKLLLTTTLLITLTFSLIATAYSDEFQDMDKEIEELRQKIEESQTRQRTLSSEIQVMDNKIMLMELQVEGIKAKIKVLGDEINDLTNKIDRLEITLSRLSEILLNRIVTTYKVNRISYLPILFASEGISDLINRIKYIQQAQAHDREVMLEVQLTKLNFGEQKELREKKKIEQEQLKTQLEIQKNELDEQKSAKQALLEQTRNDEQEYQRLLQQALAEKQALEAALVSGEKVGSVKTGDPIALVGNTGYPGCSTGKHLHFEIRKDNQWVNAGDYLKSRTVNDQQDPDHNNWHDISLGNGDWEWPIEGNIILTQHYGHTPYSWRYAYSGGIHTGLDMYSSTSDVIRAPKDGELYSAEQSCGGSSIIKIKYIEHSDGLISFYLHVQ